jgi:hypothetical protein
MTEKKNIWEEITKATGVPYFQRVTLRDLILSVQKTSEICAASGNSVTDGVSVILDPDVLATVTTDFKRKFYQTFLATTEVEKKFYEDLMRNLDRSFIISRMNLIGKDPENMKDTMVVWGQEIEMENGGFTGQEIHLISLYVNPTY